MLSLAVASILGTKHLHNICTMLDKRRRRWANVVQMLYKCFVFPGVMHLKIKQVIKLDPSFK